MLLDRATARAAVVVGANVNERHIEHALFDIGDLITSYFFLIGWLAGSQDQQDGEEQQQHQ